MFGLMGSIPDYSMIIVGSNMGLQRMTREHLGISLALKIPFFIVMTKIDMCPENIFKETLDKIKTLVKSKDVGKIGTVVDSSTDEAQLKLYAQSMPGILRI
jgi:GTPase